VVGRKLKRAPVYFGVIPPPRAGCEIASYLDVAEQFIGEADQADASVVQTV
jgi:hypothetical protein